MTEYPEEQFRIGSISTLDSGDRWGIPDTPQHLGVLRSTVGGQDTHVTLIVDRAQAELLTTAIDYLDGEITAAPSAIHWMRLGWPEEWQTHCEPNAWIECVDGHAADPRDRDIP